MIIWSDECLDLYALIVLVLAPGEIAGVFAGTGQLALGFQLIRSLPLLLIAIIVTLLAVFRPEALAGERPRRSRAARSPRPRGWVADDGVGHTSSHGGRTSGTHGGGRRKVQLGRGEQGVDQSQRVVLGK
jgi:hypothetical protein